MDGPPLSDEAKENLRRARAAAEAEGSHRASAEQILAALADSPGARTLLALFDADPERLKEALAIIAGHGGPPPDPGAEELTVELAREEAARHGHGAAGPEHLLLGLTAQQGSLAAGLLESVGIELPAARDAVRFLHGELPGWTRPPAPVRGPSANWAPLVRDSSPQGRQAAMRVAAALEPFGEGPGRLVRVVAIGLGIEVSGVLVELIALEAREGMAILSLRSHTGDGVMAGPPSLSVSDDIGTRYEVLPALWSAGERGSRGEVWIAPRPPDAATSLEIEIATLGGHSWSPMPSLPGSGEITGPWRFDVLLRQ